MLNMDSTDTSRVVEALYNRSMNVIARLRARGDVADEGASPGTRRAPRFSITRAAELVGRTGAAIREAEKEGRLPEVARTQSGRRVGYSLTEINAMRGVFGTRPWRDQADPLAIIAVQNFKGGVGKSTVSVHLAQFLATRGYRVCLIDCDSQGSSTTMLGYIHSSATPKCLAWHTLCGRRTGITSTLSPPICDFTQPNMNWQHALPAAMECSLIVWRRGWHQSQRIST
jgi:chromosome partitioning protein